MVVGLGDPGLQARRKEGFGASRHGGDEAEREKKLYTWKGLHAVPSCLFTIFIVDVVHHDHHSRRTPSLAQSSAEREEDKRLFLHRRRCAHPRKSRFRSFLL